ncbi:hypothetical protein P7K49_013478 [Saguinus oedipus]|uniref:Uncharacterized protein n=1 Tax=Saguinus oedipus TaxID=9490 RepID=A0ABQ9VG51_SAGOE|nr:hypothetical protein P7K49_013478 [Saguinus oedipus]
MGSFANTALTGLAPNAGNPSGHARPQGPRSVGPRDPLTNSPNSGASRPSRPPTWREHLGHRTHQDQQTQSTAPEPDNSKMSAPLAGATSAAPSPRLETPPPDSRTARALIGQSGVTRAPSLYVTVFPAVLGVPIVAASAAFSGHSPGVVPASGHTTQGVGGLWSRGALHLRQP